MRIAPHILHAFEEYSLQYAFPSNFVVFVPYAPSCPCIMLARQEIGLDGEHKLCANSKYRPPFYFIVCKFCCKLSYLNLCVVGQIRLPNIFTDVHIYQILCVGYHHHRVGIAVSLWSTNLSNCIDCDWRRNNVTTTYAQITWTA